MGYLLNKLGKLSDEDVKIKLDNVQFTVSKVNNRPIEYIKVKF